VRALNLTSIRLAEKLIRFGRQVLEKVMGTKAGLREALKLTATLRTNILLLLRLSFIRVLGRNMIIKRLLSRRLIITMPALVLEGSTMLSLDVHVNCGLILLGKGAMGTLELSVGRAQILESHFGDSLCCGPPLQFFVSHALPTKVAKGKCYALPTKCNTVNTKA